MIGRDVMRRDMHKHTSRRSGWRMNGYMGRHSVGPFALGANICGADEKLTRIRAASHRSARAARVAADMRKHLLLLMM